MGSLLKESSLSIVILNFQAICIAPNTYVSPIHQFKEINFNATLVIFQLTHLNPRFHLLFHENLCKWFPQSHLSLDCHLHHNYCVTIPQINWNQISPSPNLPWVSTTVSTVGDVMAHSTVSGGGGSVEGVPSLLGFDENLPEILLLSWIRRSNTALSSFNPVQYV